MGAFLSPQAYIALSDPEANPALQDPIQIAKLKRVRAGAENELEWAKKYGVTVLWGTDIFGPEAFFDTMLREWEFRAPFFTPIEQLQQATGNNARMLERSGLKNPYPEGPLGVIEPGAYADILLVDGDPTEDITIMVDPEKNFRVITKDGKIYKNTL
ncbi:MAG: amidohydrolase family protein [Myxococcota bacterium]|nr:amidohydrolase family protein [Myxococcota bacterium]